MTGKLSSKGENLAKLIAGMPNQSADGLPPLMAQAFAVDADIQAGKFAKNWIAEAESGYPNFKQMRQQDANHPIEIVGAKLRDMMPFLDPVKLPQPATV